MYKIVLIFGILSNLLLYSCDNGEVEKQSTQIFNYTNELEYNVKIVSYKNINMEQFELNPSDILNFKVSIGFGSDCSINGVESQGSECLLIFSDSLKIIFDSSKFLKFDRNTNSSMNILKQKNYDYEKINSEHIYSYNFTELDYNNAEPCNGNCN